MLYLFVLLFCFYSILALCVFFLFATFISFLSIYPDEYKSKVVCEGERMRLSCKRGMQIAVYSAMFGRTLQGTLECPLHHRRALSVGEAPFSSHIAGSKTVEWLRKLHFYQKTQKQVEPALYNFKTGHESVKWRFMRHYISTTEARS